MLWMPTAMDDRQDDDLVAGRVEVHRVRKAADESSTGVALHARIGQRAVKDCRDRGLERRDKDGTEADTLCLVPISRIE